MGEPREGELVPLLEKLTGQKAPFCRSAVLQAEELLNKGGIGYSQFNEILLLLGFDRATDAFFQFIANGKSRYENGAAIESSKEFREGIDRFRKFAMLRYGNIKYAFKYLSQLDSEDLAEEINILEPIEEDEFHCRHEPVHPIEPIGGEESHYLGYLIEKELQERLKTDPTDEDAKSQWEKRNEIVQRGERNHEAYLASDHMDVYVATSMREKHDFYIVNAVASRIFRDEKLAPLKLRWFDPTQAYCPDRIDKGLSEALMLKRAKCTLYLAQETDTLGKDSELACTLAQGKPVVAFVPKIEKEDEAKVVKWLLSIAKKLYPDQGFYELLRDHLRVFSPNLAWEDAKVQKWLADPNAMNESEIQELLARTIRKHYDKRADTLKHYHPLGIQVNLETGVANGVLVARSTEECVQLLYRIVTNQLEFDIEETNENGHPYLLLKERITKSVFRIVTNDALLTNAFWNFYLE